MSIPSIRFKAPPQNPASKCEPRAGGRGSRTRTHSVSLSQRNNFYTLDFSSTSDSNDGSDDLPTLGATPKASMVEIPHDEELSDVLHERGEEQKVPEEVNWRSRAATDFLPRAPQPPSFGNGSKRRKIRRPIRRYDNALAMKPRYQSDIESYGNTDDDEEISPRQQVEMVTRPERLSLCQTRSRTCDRFKRKTRPSDEPQSFIVIRELKKNPKKKHSVDFRMMLNEQAVFFSISTKDEIGPFDIISTSIPVVPNSQDNVAIVRKQNHGKRFTLITNEAKLNDDREAERLGMAYVKLLNFNSKQKTFRIAFRSGDKPNYPISKRMELSRIAESGEKFPFIRSYINRLPVIGPDGKQVNTFGTTFVIESLKNYIITDENDKVIFMLYKCSEGSYTVKANAPITPLMAFALSISIIHE